MKVACPAVRATVPSAVAPSLNVTLPVGVAPPVTVAVNVTDCPTIEGFKLETKAVVVGVPFTTWITAGEVLAIWIVSPA